MKPLPSPEEYSWRVVGILNKIKSRTEIGLIILTRRILIWVETINLMTS